MANTSTSTKASAYTETQVNPVARAGYDAFNRRDFSALDKIFADTTEVINIATGERLIGIPGVASFMKGWIDGFSDARAVITSIRQAGDTVVCEFRGTGTHDGVFHTPMGDIPPTGKKVDVEFCDVMRLDRDRIVQIKTYFDSATFAKQLGVK
jgi:steroid delta-isomerase-like uncharacterized protein